MGVFSSRSLFFLTALLFSIFSVQHSFALPANSKGLECPMPSPEYSKVLSRLTTFKNQLLNPENCQSITDQLSHLELFYSSPEREIIKSLFEEREVNSLSPDELKALNAYSEKLSAKVSSVVETVLKTKDCKLPEDSLPSFLTSIAAITQEVTSVAAAYTGPYGIPIALGGSTFAAILRGIDQIFGKSSGYNFNRTDHRQLFVRTLCVYHDIKQEINGILDPRKRKEIFGLLDSEMKIKLDKLESTSQQQCKTYREWREVRDTVQLKAFVLMKNLEMITMTMDGVPAKSEVEKCSQISNLIYNKRSVFKQIENQMFKDFSNSVCKSQEDATKFSALEEITDMFETLRKQEAIPTRAFCFNPANEKTLAERNRTSIGIIREMARWSVGYYDGFLGDMIEGATPVATTDGEKINPLEWLEGTMRRQEWGRLESKKLDRLLNSGSNNVQHDIVDLMQKIQEPLYTEYAPNFLQWHVIEAGKSLELFEKNLNSAQSEVSDSLEDLLNHKGLYSKYSSSLTSLDKSLQMLSTLPVMNSYDHPHVYELTASLLPYLDRSRFAVGVVEEYCTYFAKAGAKTSALKSTCESEDFASIRRSVAGYGPMRNKFSSYFEWCHQTGKINADWLEGLRAQIRACHLKLPPIELEKD